LKNAFSKVTKLWIVIDGMHVTVIVQLAIFTPGYKAGGFSLAGNISATAILANFYRIIRHYYGGLIAT
jgi:hypothetical protein